MSIAEQYDRQIPEYYPTMYMDGYQPHQILHAVHRQMLREHYERKEADNIVIPTINFKASVKVK